MIVLYSDIKPRLRIQVSIMFMVGQYPRFALEMSVLNDYGEEEIFFDRDWTHQRVAYVFKWKLGQT